VHVAQIVSLSGFALNVLALTFATLSFLPCAGREHGVNGWIDGPAGDRLPWCRGFGQQPSERNQMGHYCVPFAF
jgi:hypothetical protein